MIVVQHPAFPTVLRTVENSDARRWEAAGWLRHLDGDRAERLAEMVAEHGPGPSMPDVCPTCGAVGDQPCVTASGNETSRHAARPDA